MKDYKIIREDGTFEILKNFKGGRWDAINTVRCMDKNTEYARLDDVDAAVEYETEDERFCLLYPSDGAKYYLQRLTYIDSEYYQKDADLLRIEKEKKFFEGMEENNDKAYWLENDKIIEISKVEYDKRLNKINKDIENLYKKSFIVKFYEGILKFILGIWWKIDWFMFGHIRKKQWEKILDKYYTDRSISSSLLDDW